VLDNWVARGLFRDEDLTPETDRESSKSSPQASPAPSGAPGKVASIMSLLQQKANAAAGGSGDAPTNDSTANRIEDPKQSSAAPPVMGSNAPSKPTYGAPPFPVPLSQSQAGGTASSLPPPPPNVGPGSFPATAGHYGPMAGSGQPAMYGSGPPILNSASSNSGWMPPNSAGEQLPVLFFLWVAVTLTPNRLLFASFLPAAQPQTWNSGSSFTYGSSQPPQQPNPMNVPNGSNPLRNNFDFSYGPNGEKHPLTKTKMCKRIVESGTCRFGAACG
jgi:hypothetical protein